MACATALVPPAKASNSNTPMGPFQTIVFASTILEANSVAESGPMSRPMRSAGIASAATTSYSAPAEKPAAATMSVGRTISTPDSLAVAR